MYNLIHCPACNASHYQYHYSTTTAMGWTQEYKDGVPLNSNPNITTSYYTCCECKHKFSVQEQYGKVIEIIDDGPSPEVPVINTPITVVPNEPGTIDKDSFLAKSSNFDNSVTIATSEEFKDLKLEMEKMNEYMLGIATDLRLIYSVLSKKT